MDRTVRGCLTASTFDLFSLWAAHSDPRFMQQEEISDPGTTQLYCGIDIGTSSTKVLMIDAAGELKALTSRSYPLEQPRPGYAEQDPDGILEAILAALTDAIQQVDHSKIEAMAFSSAMHSVLLLNRDMAPFTPLITWADSRSESEAVQLRQQPEGQDIFQKTGTPIHPMAPLSKLIWMQKHQPDWLKQAHKIVSIKSYVIYRLFDVLVEDHSIASATGLFDIFNLSWYELALKRAGIREDQLPQPVPTRHKLAQMKPAYAERIGLDQETSCFAGASDGCLANLGEHVVTPNEAALTIGTSGAVRVTVPQPKTDAQGRLFTYILDHQSFVIGGSINNGGIMIQWFKNKLASLGSDEDLEQMLQQAGALPAGNEGLICMPYLLGERAPNWNSYDRGAFIGVQFHHTAAHFLRGIMEGISMTLRQITDAIEETCGPVDVIHVNGGFVRSPEWLQILADVLNKKLIISGTREASATGAAYLAMQAAGNQTPAPAFDATSEASIVPIPEHVAVYEDLLPVFKELYQKLRP